jgi:hypothetical protein
MMCDDRRLLEFIKLWKEKPVDLSTNRYLYAKRYAMQVLSQTP